MKQLLVATLMTVSGLTQAQTIITPQGSYQVQQSGSTTYVTQTSNGSSTQGVAVAVPVNVNPVTGIGVVHGPQGSYMVQRTSGGTTFVTQTSKGK